MTFHFLPRCKSSGEWFIEYERPLFPGSFFCVLDGLPSKAVAEQEIERLKAVNQVTEQALAEDRKHRGFRP